jgi:[acyl-carrier-protein] S-malonyltransferase
MKKAVFLFPGQGSQYVGMGKDLYENFSSVKGLFEQASDELKMDLKGLCFDGPDDVLKETVNVQPAVTLVNAACLTALKEEGVTPSAAAGHSLGEYAALFAAGVVGFSLLMELVKNRGTFMQEAADENPGGMVAIMGLGSNEVSAICAEASSAGSVELANHNSPSQVILTGEKEALKRAVALAKEKKAKLTIPLKVSGPWHSRFMAPARERMAEVLSAKTLNRAEIPVVANVTGGYETDPEEIRDNLTKQITSPVLWTSSMERLLADGHTIYIEAGPKKVLKGLMRDISKDARVHNVDTSETLKNLLSSIG